ncbi:MAG TPA: DUF4209 domain-containing protein [Candidatus Elarobacter sp.]|nr:DUF4209 domain-containing protein [Candidatus Elarobacter sp.]
MDESAGPKVFGLPEDFELSLQEAQQLDVDAVLSQGPPNLALHDAEQRIRLHLESTTDQTAAQALYLLFTVLQFGTSLAPRQPFNERWSGTYDDGKPCRGPLPEDLTDAHVRALSVMADAIETPVVRARVAHVLWLRQRPRNRSYAALAIDAYLRVAEATFDPEEWSESAQHLTRAFELATALGKNSQERRQVVTAALDLVERLKANEPRFYTERIAVLIYEALTAAEMELLFERVKSIAEMVHASANSDVEFHRGRAYYDAAIKLSNPLQRFADAKLLQLARAETHIAEADVGRSEMQRSSSLRLGLRALRQAGAPRERLNVVAQLLDEAQELSVNEMARIGTPFSTDETEKHIRDLVRNRDPIVGLWILASQPLLAVRAKTRTLAEEGMKHAPLTFGLRHTKLTADGLRDGEVPGSFGSDDNYESALEGAMRMYAAHGRVISTYGVIEPGRTQLLLEHEYTLEAIYLALRSRTFIPYGHEILWAKGIHAGLVGEFDVALHLLVPQLEHALREVLRREREIIYGTSSSGVQSLIGLEKVLLHQKTIAIFGEDVVFTIGAALAQRLGANMRNMVAHGMITDGQSAGGDAIYVWWLCLHMLFGFGSPPLADESNTGTTTEDQPSG